MCEHWTLALPGHRRPMESFDPIPGVSDGSTRDERGASVR
jgi:hypothetical protein